MQDEYAKKFYLELKGAFSLEQSEDEQKQMVEDIVNRVYEDGFEDGSNNPI